MWWRVLLRRRLGSWTFPFSEHFVSPSSLQGGGYTPLLGIGSNHIPSSLTLISCPHPSLILSSFVSYPSTHLHLFSPTLLLNPLHADVFKNTLYVYSSCCTWFSPFKCFLAPRFLPRHSFSLSVFLNLQASTPVGAEVRSGARSLSESVFLINGTE